MGCLLATNHVQKNVILSYLAQFRNITSIKNLLFMKIYHHLLQYGLWEHAHGIGLLNNTHSSVITLSLHVQSYFLCHIVFDRKWYRYHFLLHKKYFLWNISFKIKQHYHSIHNHCACTVINGMLFLSIGHVTIELNLVNAHWYCKILIQLC